MSNHITSDDLLVQAIARATNVPVKRIQDFVVVVQHDKGVAMLHTLCCNAHAREGLALVAATPPDAPDVDRFTGSN